MPMGGEQPVLGKETLMVEARPSSEVTFDQSLLQSRIDVAPGVLGQRDEIIGSRSDQRVLEIKQPAGGHALAPVDHHQIVDMIVTQYQRVAAFRNIGKRGLP